MAVGGISHLSNVLIIPGHAGPNLTESRRLSNARLTYPLRFYFVVNRAMLTSI